MNHVKIFLPDGKTTEITVGSDGVTKIFSDREKPNTIVILMEDGIVEYGNISYIAMKDYAKKA